MKRLHVHISVADLAAAKKFYSALFGAAPSVEKPDYAKWALDDPRVNLAISQHAGNKTGVNHLGVQAETEDELKELHARLANADVATHEEKNAECCYAKSDKHWAIDPNGVVWEMFQTMGEVATYGDDRGPESLNAVLDA